MSNTDLARGARPEPGVIRLARSLINDRTGSPGWLAAAYLGLLTLAELLARLSIPGASLFLHGLLLVTLLVHAGLVDRRSLQRLLYSLSLAPLMRLINLSLPQSVFPISYGYLIAGAPLFIAALYTAHINRLTAIMLGLKPRAWRVQILVGVSGILLGYLEYRILRPAPLVEGISALQIWLPALALLIFAGFLEEFIFRGLMQYAAIRSLKRSGIWYVAALFATLHLGSRPLLDVVFLFSTGLYFAVATRRSGTVLGAALAHGLANVSLFFVFPLLYAAPALPPGPIPTPQLVAAPVVPTRMALPSTTATQFAPVTRTPLPSLPKASTDMPTLTQTPFVSHTSDRWVPDTLHPGEPLAPLPTELPPPPAPAPPNPVRILPQPSDPPRTIFPTVLPPPR